MAKYGINVPEGKPAFTLAEVDAAAKELQDEKGEVNHENHDTACMGASRGPDAPTPTRMGADCSQEPDPRGWPWTGHVHQRAQGRGAHDDDSKGERAGEADAGRHAGDEADWGSRQACQHAVRGTQDEACARDVLRNRARPRVVRHHHDWVQVGVPARTAHGRRTYARTHTHARARAHAHTCSEGGTHAHTYTHTHARSEGGTSIEDLAEKFPDKIIKVPVDNTVGITDEQAMTMAKGLEVTGDVNAAAQQIKNLYTLFVSSDCTMVEVRARMALSWRAHGGSRGHAHSPVLSALQPETDAQRPPHLAPAHAHACTLRGPHRSTRWRRTRQAT
jgi:hypothetical protein